MGKVADWFEKNLGIKGGEFKGGDLGKKYGKGWHHFKTKKKAIKRSMRWNKDIATSDEAKPVSPTLTPGRFKKWLAKHRNG